MIATMLHPSPMVLPAEYGDALRCSEPPCEVESGTYPRVQSPPKQSKAALRQLRMRRTVLRSLSSDDKPVPPPGLSSCSENLRHSAQDQLCCDIFALKMDLVDLARRLQRIESL